MKVLLCAIGIFFVYIVIEIAWETHHFKVTRYEVKTNKLGKEMRALKLVFLSDLHNQKYGTNSENLVETIKKEMPDLILIGGDMLIGKKDVSYEPAATFVSQLPAIAPVYYANGNHEQRMHEQRERYGDSFEKYRRTLEDAGVVFLMNDTVTIEKEKQQIILTGMELPKKCYQKFKRIALSQEDIETCVGKASQKYQILMAHHPRYAKSYWKWGADLVLSGHLHGGVARIPFLGAAISPQFQVFPRYSGDYYREGEKGIIVSKGLGVHTIKIRFWNPAEVIVFTLQGEG